jgi:alcohol dehydrogenase class IV
VSGGPGVHPPRDDHQALIEPFSVARLPHVEFGAGRIEALPDAIARHGRRALIVSGARSFRRSERWPWLLGALTARDVGVETTTVDGEPSPALVDEAVATHRDDGIEVVVGIGGGSALDAAKAIAGLLRTGTSVRDHLEGVGRVLPYAGPAVPFIAVPTTAGTGSEATKNAVISEVGPEGFKRSFRDERLVAVEAIVDPDLLLGSPPAVVAANGMDALTQLLESYVSRRHGPLTDALALRGLEVARDGLLPWHRAVVTDAPAEASQDARAAMALAALLSGICLANTGLGVVHGLASPLGALFPIPHGAACGAVLVAGTATNLQALADRAPDDPALGRYAVAGRILAGLPAGTSDAEAHGALLETLGRWRDALGVAGLAGWGVDERDLAALVAGSRGSSMRTNPIELADDEVAEVIRASLR